MVALASVQVVQMEARAVDMKAARSEAAMAVAASATMGGS